MKECKPPLIVFAIAIKLRVSEHVGFLIKSYRITCSIDFIGHAGKLQNN